MAHREAKFAGLDLDLIDCCYTAQELRGVFDRPVVLDGTAQVLHVHVGPRLAIIKVAIFVHFPKTRQHCQGCSKTLGAVSSTSDKVEIFLAGIFPTKPFVAEL